MTDPRDRVVEAARRAETLFDPVFGTDAVNGDDFAEWLECELRPALRALDAASKGEKTMEKKQ